ncbi:MAG: histidine phosphatase family protein [Clostridia bacterium]|nr:histidine phosphatase family protein [Clostridia bacterium]
MTKLILVRHGQSLANAQHIFAGHSDFDLSELGHTQARLVADYLSAHESIDAIYASDLLRAYHTATPTAERLGLSVIKDTCLREIYAGQWDGLPVRELEERFPEDFHLWKTDYSHVRPTGGESIPEVYRRIVPHICALARKHDGKCLLLATHATVVRSFDAFAHGLGAEETGKVNFASNASINIFTYDNGAVTSVCSDFTEHLGELTSGVPRALQA